METYGEESNAADDQTADDDAKAGSSSFFKDVNPEADCRTAFVRRLPYAGGSAQLGVCAATPQEVIDKQLGKLLLTEFRRVNPTKIRGDCFEIFQRANPKGVSQICEMCPEKATLCCRNCTLTYYCSWTHRMMDSMHPQLCSRIKLLRWPMPYSDNLSDRQRFAAQKILVMEKLLEELIREAFIGLYQKKNFDKAIGILFQCLKYVDRVFGADDVDCQVITIHTAICECQIGLGQLSQADKSLNSAATCLRNAESKDPVPKLNFANAQVFRAQGLLNYQKGHYDDAAFYFSECIYHVSEVTSPTDIRVCSGYFNLGKCFLASKQPEKAFSVIKFCFKLWQNYLADVFTELMSASQKPTFFKSEWRVISLFTELEAAKQLGEASKISSVMKEDNAELYCMTAVCQGIMAYFANEYEKANELANVAKLFKHEVRSNAGLFSLCKLLEKMSGRKIAEGRNSTSIHQGKH